MLREHSSEGATDAGLTEEASLRVLTLVGHVAHRTFTALDRATDHCPGAAVARAVQFASEGLAEGVSLPGMARAAGLSKFHFLRKFRSETGLTPGAFVQRYRISAAMDLLVASSCPVKSVACKVGYKDHAAFCRAFSKATGTTPSLYRLTRSAPARPPVSKHDGKTVG